MNCGEKERERGRRMGKREIEKERGRDLRERGRKEERERWTGIGFGI